MLKIKCISNKIIKENKCKNHPKLIKKVEIHFYPFVNSNSKCKNLHSKEKQSNNYYLNTDFNIYVFVTLLLH